MKILAFSDLHGEEAALEKLRTIAPDYEHVFICGDFSRSTSFAEQVLDSFPKAFVIPGNWDSKDVNEVLFRDSRCIHGKRAELSGFNIVGFGYANHTPYGTYGERSEKELLEGLSNLDIDSNTVLLLHCPPKNHFDEIRGAHIGSESIATVIREKQPFAALFGHVHEHSGVDKLGKTTLVKLPAANGMRACALEIKDKRITAEFISL